MSTQTTSLARVRFIEQRGKRILLIDFSGLQTTEEILAEVETARALVATQPPASLLTLTHVKGARYTPPVMEALKGLAAANKPYVRAAAVVGMEGLHRVLFRAVILFSRRNIEAFDSMNEAREWLATQE
ncbi:MAG TPA: STAS/SEC14 domain-containing protein [Longimicrobium sp.]